MLVFFCFFYFFLLHFFSCLFAVCFYITIKKTLKSLEQMSKWAEGCILLCKPNIEISIKESDKKIMALTPSPPSPPSQLLYMHFCVENHPVSFKRSSISKHIKNLTLFYIWFYGFIQTMLYTNCYFTQNGIRDCDGIAAVNLIFFNEWIIFTVGRVYNKTVSLKRWSWEMAKTEMVVLLVYSVLHVKKTNGAKFIGEIAVLKAFAEKYWDFQGC